MANFPVEAAAPQDSLGLRLRAQMPMCGKHTQGARDLNRSQRGSGMTVVDVIFV